MKSRKPEYATADANATSRPTVLVALAVACLLLLVVALLRPRQRAEPAASPTPVATAKSPTPGDSAARDRLFARLPQRRSAFEPPLTATQIVSNKVAQFGRSRRELVHAIAKKHGVAVAPEFERFFDAVEAGQWGDIDAQFKTIQELRNREEGLGQPEGFFKLWPAVLETFGCAEVAHDWPAQKLLDYGEAVLGSLRLGMVYVGGTDPGRFIPTLLNETSGGEPHLILTQNALADGSYLDFIGHLHEGQMTTLTHEDSQRAFSEYLADAQRRFNHDRDFPGEPKQIRPGEDIQIRDNKVQVSGNVAVMNINELLLQNLMRNNPDLVFAIEESFPLRSTYGGAVPLGPIMELGAADAESNFTAERAAQSVDYWRAQAQRLAADAEASASPETLKTYSKMAVAQANLMGHRNYSVGFTRFDGHLGGGALNPKRP